jgi:hypothetical protein
MGRTTMKPKQASNGLHPVADQAYHDEKETADSKTLIFCVAMQLYFSVRGRTHTNLIFKIPVF